jgi:four helix bundle protein
VTIAIGSLGECDTQLEIARRLNYLTGSDLSECVELGGDLRRVLFGLRRSLRSRLRDKRADTKGL